MYTLPELPYAYDALEPFIDARTMEFHHKNHHQIYIDKLNSVLTNTPDLASQSIDTLLVQVKTLPENIRSGVRNFGGGHANHTMFWSVMQQGGGGEPEGTLAAALTSAFGSVQKFRDEFSKAATTQFGSGWAWLVRKSDGVLAVMQTANQDTPLSDGVTPLLCLDVWEHAYYLKYQYKRADYIAAWWNIVNWSEVERRLKA